MRLFSIFADRMRFVGEWDFDISFRRLVVLFQCYCLVGLKAQTHKLGAEPETQEYCPDDKFVASCGPGEVILMETARYGRMKIGKCVKTNLGYLGCAVDVLRLIDSRCSGQERCEVPVMDPALRQLRPCPNDVTWYLEAGYRCVKVMEGDTGECQSGARTTTLTAESGYLASITSTQSGVGTSECPWTIKAPAGQQINITMYNFIESLSLKPGDISPLCYELAVLRDGTSHRSLTACANEPRQRVGHVSQTNEVTVEFLFKPSHGRLQFLLHYQAFGCGSITIPPRASATREGETMTIKCDKSGETWFLTCSKHRWHGDIGNCSEELAAQKTWGMKEVFGGNNSFPFGILIVVAVGVALGVFLGGTLLAFVSMYMKKKRLAREQNRAPDHNHPFQTYTASEEDTLEERKMQSFTDYSTKTLDTQSLQRDRDAYKHTVIPHPQYCTHPRGPHMYESPKFV